jgi:ABC-type lipoprotein release transport system permease subunit
VVNSVLLKPAPFPDPERLVLFINTPGTGTGASPVKFQHWREQTSAVQDVSAFRTQEIGIRLALGAGTASVRRMVVFHGMRLAIVGVAVGIGAALGLTRLITTFLFGVRPKDPLVFTGVAVLLSLISLLAVWIPARRATRIDPVIALRYE